MTAPRPALSGPRPDAQVCPVCGAQDVSDPLRPVSADRSAGGSEVAADFTGVAVGGVCRRHVAIEAGHHRSQGRQLGQLRI